jgi:hypothetical protein
MRETLSQRIAGGRCGCECITRLARARELRFGRVVGRGVSSTRGGSCDAGASFLSQKLGRRSGFNDVAASAGARKMLQHGLANHSDFRSRLRLCPRLLQPMPAAWSHLFPVASNAPPRECLRHHCPDWSAPALGCCCARLETSDTATGPPSTDRIVHRSSPPNVCVRPSYSSSSCFPPYFPSTCHRYSY